MSGGIFGIGVSAVQNAQIALMTAEHNIANVTTPGYSRQRAISATNTPYYTGAGYVGTGAHIATIERMYNSFVIAQVNREQNAASELEKYASELAQINNILTDDIAGLSPAIKDFFDGIQQVAAEPSSLTARQSMISMAQVVAARFQSLDSRLTEQYRSMNTQIEGDVTMINSYAHQIADLNLQITVAESAYQPPNDLYDRRDALVAELNKLVRVSATLDSNGSYNVSIGTGHQLVTATHVTEVAAVQSSIDPTRLSVGLKMPNGIQELPDQQIIGGSLGGVLKFRSETLDKTSNALGRIAASLALTFNAQQELGQDLNGNISGDANFISKLFTVPQPKVIPYAKNPAGSGEVVAEFIAPPPYNGNFYTDLTGSDYKLEQLGGLWTLTRLTDNVSWSDATIPGLNAVIDSSPQGSQGFTLSEPGSPAAGSYLIQPTRETARNIAVNPQMAADARQLAVAAPIRTSPGNSNIGNAVISAGKVEPGYTAPTAGAPVTLTYSGGSFTGFPAASSVTVTVNGVSTSYTAGTPVPYSNSATITFDGISFGISGIPENGDEFVISKNTDGITDNRNAILFGQLQTSNTMSSQTTGFQSAYAQLVGELGSKGREITATLNAHEILLEQAQLTRDSISGVNLDEEAANLLRYQQAYQAAAKMLSIGSTLFDAILAIRG